MAGRANTGTELDLYNQLAVLEDKLSRVDKLRNQAALEAENELMQLKVSNAQKLVDRQKETTKDLVKMGKIVTDAQYKQEQENIKKTTAAKLAAELKSARAKNGGKALSKEEKAKIAAKFKEEEKQQEAALKKKYEADLKFANKYKKKKDTAEGSAEREKAASAISNALKGENKIGNTIAALKDAKDKGGGMGAFSAALTAVSDLSKQLTTQIDEIGKYKGAIDTRLQGSKSKTRSGSYWDAISSDIVGIAGASPLVKQADIVSNLNAMVGKGIAFNVEQRAFLETIKDKIATTFEANDAALKKLVRIQQEDTTAARLGMESALTAFLNNMYETTEYMSEQAATIRASLYQATALMDAKEATEFEYQVQKWMGSLYSVGMSDTAVQGIASTLGKIAAGDISGLTGDGTGNLMIMAANNAGINISDALQEGLDESKTNQLMSAMVDYLGKIYEESSNSKVVAQQFANVYGITAADLKAAKNLAGSTKNIYNNNLGYGGMLNQLNNMASSMYSRTSIGEMMGNAWENLKYTMSAGIANNPALYALFKTANLLDDLAGGIDFSIPLYMGTGSAQTFNVADIMRVGALSGSVLSGLGQMIASGSGGGISGVGMLKALGVGGTASVQRGNGGGLLSSGPTVEYSSSGIVGNSSSDDMTNKTMGDQTESTENQVAEVADNSNEVTLSTVNENVYAILTVLNDVVAGSSSLHVDMGDSSAWSNAMRGL